MTQDETNEWLRQKDQLIDRLLNFSHELYDEGAMHPKEEAAFYLLRAAFSLAVTREQCQRILEVAIARRNEGLRNGSTLEAGSSYYPDGYNLLIDHIDWYLAQDTDAE